MRQQLRMEVVFDLAAEGIALAERLASSGCSWLEGLLAEGQDSALGHAPANQSTNTNQRSKHVPITINI